MYEKYLNLCSRKMFESEDDFPGSKEPLDNLLYSLRGVKQHSEQVIENSKNIKGLSKESVKIAKELINIYNKYYKTLDSDLKNQTELLRDFYRNEGDESMAEYYETFLK